MSVRGEGSPHYLMIHNLRAYLNIARYNDTVMYD